MPVRTRSSVGSSNSGEAGNLGTTTAAGTTPAANEESEGPSPDDQRSEGEWWDLKGAALDCARDPKLKAGFEKARDATKEPTTIGRSTSEEDAEKTLGAHYRTAESLVLGALTHETPNALNPLIHIRGIGTAKAKAREIAVVAAVLKLGPRKGKEPSTYEDLTASSAFKDLDDEQRRCALRVLDVVEKVALHFLWDILEADLREAIVILLLEAKLRARKLAKKGATEDEKTDLAAFNTVPTLTWWETSAAVLKETKTIAKLSKTAVQAYTSITPIRRPAETIHQFATRVHRSRLLSLLHGQGWGEDVQAGLARQIFEMMLHDVPDERGHWDIVVSKDEGAPFHKLLKAFVGRLATRTSTRKMSRTAIIERLRRHAPDLLVFYKEIAKLVNTKQATGGKTPRPASDATLTPAEVTKYQKLLQKRYDARQCLNCGLSGHLVAACTSSPMRAVRAFTKYFFLDRTTNKIRIKTPAAPTAPEAKDDDASTDDATPSTDALVPATNYAMTATNGGGAYSYRPSTFWMSRNGSNPYGPPFDFDG